MLSDFEPIIHELPGRTIKVWAIADVHLGSAECDLEGFRAFLSRVEQDNDSFIVIAGDMCDNAITGSPSHVYGASPREQINQAVELLRPVADRILCMVSGNHELRTRKAADIDPMEVIACKLDLAHLYRENMAFVRVNLRQGAICDTHNLLVMHGASPAKKRKMHIEGVDVFISGHTHDPYVEKPARLVFNHHGNVCVKPMIHITATSWLNYGGYGAAKMYSPKATSDPQCLTLEYTNSNNSRGRVFVTW